MFKKSLVILLALQLCACSALPEDGSGESAENPTPAGDPQETENSAPEETAAQKVIWTAEPSMELGRVVDMESHPFVLGASIEYTGYPAEWYACGPKDQLDVPDYRKDAVIVEKDGGYGIMDYEGNVLFPFVVKAENSTQDYVPIHWQPWTGFIYWMENGSAQVFSPDFTKRSFVMSGGIGGYAPVPFIIDHKLYIEDLQTMDIGPFENTFGRNIAVAVDDDERNPIGCAVVSKDSEILFETEGHCQEIVNGMLKVSEKPDWSEPGKTGFVRVSDGREITGGPVYEDSGYFEDGYCPVKINGKWTYIDEDGNLIGDPVFDDAGLLNKGRAYVKYEGLYGIMDVLKTAENGIFINEEACEGDYMPKSMDIPEIAESEVIGTVTVKVDNLNIRITPSTAAEKKGKAEKSKTYDVYEIYESEGYTWYRIGEESWVADNGSWLSYAAG